MAEIEILSECMKGFINVLTARARQQFKALLYSYKQLLQIELAKLSAMIGRQDILQGLYKNAIDGFEEVLRPIEAALSQIPFTEFKACPGVIGNFGDIQNIYFDKKSELRTFTYKYAQLGFASTYFEDLRNKIENKLDSVNAIIEFLDDLASFQLEVGDPVTVYTSNTDSNGNKYPVTRHGDVASIDLINAKATVTMDDTSANEIFDVTEVQAG